MQEQRSLKGLEKFVHCMKVFAELFEQRLLNRRAIVFSFINGNYVASRIWY